MRRPRPGLGALLTLLFLAASCQGSFPTPFPQTPGQGPTPGPTPVPAIPTPASPDLRPYLAGMRPEFAADLAGMVGATRYDLRLQLDVERLLLAGQETVHYTNQEQVPLSQLYLRLYANYPGCTSWVEVGAVRLREHWVIPTDEVSRTALLVPLDPPLAAGDSQDLQLDFVVKVPQEDPCRYRDFGLNGGAITLAHVYPQVAVYDHEGWNLALGPAFGDLVYADAALYSVTLSLPAGWVVATSGSKLATTHPTSDTVALSFIAGPARDFYMVLGQNYVTMTETYQDVQVTSYFFSGHEAEGQRALTTAVEALRTFEQLFGPYRYRELDVVETAITAGGIEYPGLVTINTLYYVPDRTSLEAVTVHEVAHQWWYNLVGNDQVEEPWLDEALTTYSAVLYYEETAGEEYAAGYLDWHRRSYQSAVDNGLDAPVNMPVAAYSEEQYGPIVYAKGALFFHALREQVGEETFRQILQTYYRRYLYGIATGEDFLALVEEVAGQDVHPLYQEWILSPAEAAR